VYLRSRIRGDGRETRLHLTCATIREGEEEKKVDSGEGKRRIESVSWISMQVRTTDSRERFPIEEYSLQSWRDT